MTFPRPIPADFDGTSDNVIKLSALGYGVDRVARMLGISVKLATSIRNSHFKKHHANRQEMVAQVAMTLDLLLRPILLKYEKDSEAGHPDRRDVETALKVLETKRRLFALDQPIQLAITHFDEMSDEVLNRELGRLGINVPQLPVATSEPEKSDVEIVDAEFEVTDQV